MVIEGEGTEEAGRRGGREMAEGRWRGGERRGVLLCPCVFVKQTHGTFKTHGESDASHEQAKKKGPSACRPCENKTLRACHGADGVSS